MAPAVAVGARARAVREAPVTHRRADWQQGLSGQRARAREGGRAPLPHGDGAAFPPTTADAAAPTSPTLALPRRRRPTPPATSHAIWRRHGAAATRPHGCYDPRGFGDLGSGDPYPVNGVRRRHGLCGGLATPRAATTPSAATTPWPDDPTGCGDLGSCDHFGSGDPCAARPLCMGCMGCMGCDGHMGCGGLGSGDPVNSAMGSPRFSPRTPRKT